MEGTQIGAYRIERLLGQGGFGVVYVGVDTRLERRAAIKQLLPQLSNHRDIVERFFNEAKAAASVNHPGIVEIYDVGWHTDGSAYFAMKLLDGDSLARRLRSTGPLAIQLAATIARQVSSALVAAHARGIVHRDLKPDNIILVPDDEVAISERATVLDFGIAKLFGDNPLSNRTATGMMMGTPLYMSPEQCRGAGEVDHRTDIYALGCILFEMLAGRAPFVGQGAGEILGMHQFVEPPLLRSLRADAPPELEAVVSRALAKKPEQRYAQMSELQSALQPFAAAGGRSRPQVAPATAPLVAVDVAAPTAISESDVARVAEPAATERVVQPPAPSPPTPPAATPLAPTPPIPTPPMLVPTTTLGAASGQVEPKRKPRAALLAIGGLAVAGAVIAIVVASSSSSSTTSHNTTVADAAVLGAILDAAAAVAIDAPPVAVVVGATAPSDEEVLALTALEDAGAKLDFETVLILYQVIPKTSPLYEKATQRYYFHGANYQTEQGRRARAHVGAKECGKYSALLAKVRKLEGFEDVHITQAIKAVEAAGPCKAVANVPTPNAPSGYKCGPGGTRTVRGCVCPAGFAEARDAENNSICSNKSEKSTNPRPSITLHNDCTHGQQCQAPATCIATKETLGPVFRSCEIQCTPTTVCPTGTSCSRIPDGPAILVCR